MAWSAGLSRLGAAGIGGGGFTVSAAVRETPPNEAVMVTTVGLATVDVVIVKFALVAAATMTLAGTVAAIELLESVTTAPFEGGAAVKVTVPVEELLPTTVVGLSDTEERVETVAPGVTRNGGDTRVVPANVARMSRVNVPVTAVVGIVKVALDAPAGTVTLAGTIAMPGAGADRKTTAPPLGAGALSVIVPVKGLPPTTLVGLTDTADSSGGGGGTSTVRVALNVYRPSVAEIVTAVSTAGGKVVMGTSCPNSGAGGITTVAGTDAIAGWLLVSVMVGPPPEEMPL